MKGEHSFTNDLPNIETTEAFKGFHIRDPALHEFVFKIQNILKMRFGPKTKAPYHYIFRYYLHKFLKLTIDEKLSFRILLENTVLAIDIDKEDYKDFEEKMDSLDKEILLGVEIK